MEKSRTPQDQTGIAQVCRRASPTLGGGAGRGGTGAWPALSRGASGRGRMQHQFPDRAVKGSVEQVGEQAALRIRARVARPVNLRADRLVAVDEALLRHDLQHLENGGVPGGLVLVQNVLDIADGMRA